MKMKFCDYGCGQEALHQFKNGRWGCSEHWTKCPNNKIKYVSCGMLGKKHTDEAKKKMRNARLDNPNLFWKGKQHTKQSKLKMKKAKTGLKNYFYGKNHTNETKKKMRKAKLGRIFSEDHKYKLCISRKLSIEQIQNKYPLFFQIEEMRYEPGKEKEKIIQVHCKNHNCVNSKELGGWFTPKNYDQLVSRIWSIEKEEGNGYYYCSEECKDECPLFKKSVEQLIKEDQIRAGHLEGPWYNSKEHQIWRQQVFELDNKKCVWCGQEATIAHHILPQKIYPNLSLDPENGLSSCKECHHKYGHRDSWCTTGYLASLVCKRIIRIKEKI